MAILVTFRGQAEVAGVILFICHVPIFNTDRKLQPIPLRATVMFVRPTMFRHTVVG